MVVLDGTYTIVTDNIDRSQCDSYANNPSCKLAERVCTEPGGTRTINGLPVYKDCWAWKENYSCISGNYVDYCAAVRNTSGCSEIQNTCTSTAWNGTCNAYEKQYRCDGKVGEPLPPNVALLNTEYTVVTDTIDRAQCASYENNSSCTLADKVCVEPGGTRNINGKDVYKDCWSWKETYTCIAQNYRNYCIPLRQTAGCSETGYVCKSTAWNGTCNEYERTYRCDGKQGDPLPPNVTYLDTTYTIIKDQLNTAQCDINKNNPNCTIASHTCTQPGGTRNINGLDVYKDCWEWTDEYVCASTDLQSDCGDLLNNPSCTEKGNTCIDKLPGGQCGLRERKFSCKVKDGTTKDVTTCDQGVCVNGVCSAPSTDPDSDFGQVIAGLEAQRQMGDYFDPATGQIFKGTGASCSVKLGGLVNCCKAKSGGGTQSNNYMMQGIKMIANEGVRFLGSPYMYDALYSTDLIPTSLLNTIYGPEKILQSGSEYQFGSGGGLSFYGVTYVPGASPPFAFDPTSFAIAIAIQVITQYLQCDQSEQLLGLRKDQRLCTPVGSWCSSKVLGVCITKKEGYCCYNSRLSRIVNEQGRAQIGKSYGDPRSPDCSGFTTAELERLDFSRMDLSEFIADIVPKNLNTNLLDQRARQTITDKSTNYFNSGSYKN